MNHRDRKTVTVNIFKNFTGARSHSRLVLLALTVTVDFLEVGGGVTENGAF